MNLYRRALKYTKPLTEIDEKISRLEEEMMTTSNMYVTGQHVDAQPPVEPTVGEIPDGSLGDFSDLNSFTQNADTDNVDQLTVNDDAGTLTPITQIMETSNLSLGEGITAVAMGRHGRAATGMVYGFIDSRNVFNEVFVIGGLRPSGYGQSDIIDDGLDWWHEYVEGKSIEAVGWKCYNTQSLYDALYTPHATNVGPGGTWNLHTNSLLFVKNQNFLIDAGSPNRPASFTVLTRDGLGDPNFLSVLMGVSNLVVDALVDGFGKAADAVRNIIDLVGDGSAAAQQLGDYANWLDNPTNEPTQTRLDGGDKANIINEADRVLEQNFNPDGSPKTDVAGDMVNTLIGQAVQTGLNNSTAATNIHGQLPTTNNEVVIHNQPTNQEGLSPDGNGGMNVNDGYDFTSVSQFDIGSGPMSGVVGQQVAQMVTSMPVNEIIGQPRQPIQTNLSANQLNGTLLGNVINYNNVFVKKKIEESFVMEEDKSDPLNKYKLLKFMLIDDETLQKLKERYPASDPRLAELNWKMDQQLAASDTYIEKHFPENQRLFNKVQKSIKRSIKLTDPKTFKDVKVPSFKKLLSVDYVNEVGSPKKKPKLKNRNKKTAARFIKKPRKKTAMELIDEKIIQLEKDMKKFDKK